MGIFLQFGAGNIGRGFMGELFAQAGYEVVFVDVRKDLVDLLNARGFYPLRILDAYTREAVEKTIGPVRAFLASDTEPVAAIFARAEVAGTAVGAKNLGDLAPLIALGVRRRQECHGLPLDIYLCENAKDAASTLKKAVFQYLTEDERLWAEEHIGFVATSVARMVPSRDAFPECTDPLLVVADAYREFPYDAQASRACPPRIPGARPVANFEAEFFRKLHTHNLGHAALAYLGYLKGYTYVHEGFSDPLIGEVFEKALDETTEALFRRFLELDWEEHRRIREDIRVRFGNPLLRDTVHRVARDPLRKLAPSDRLIGSALLCLEEGVFPEYVAWVCAAALCYDWQGDPEALKLQDFLRTRGLTALLQEYCGISPCSTLGRRIGELYQALRNLRKG